MSRISNAQMAQSLSDRGFAAITDENGKLIWDIRGTYVSTKEAYDVVNLETGVNIEKKSKAEPIRVDPRVAATVRKMAQYLSNGEVLNGGWGETEVSIDKLRNWVIDGMQANLGMDVTPRMVNNFINTMKRKGEIVATRKGYFHATDTSKVNLAIFFA